MMGVDWDQSANFSQRPVSPKYTPNDSGTSRRTKLIIGVDFGTTFTGVAWVHEHATNPKDIKCFTDWPGVQGDSNEHYEKTPSVIAYAAENPEQDGVDHWGYQVEAGSISYAWTKLLLDRKAEQTLYDDPNLYNSGAGPTLRLPENKDAVQVVSEYLGKIYDHLTTTFAFNCGGADIFDITPVEYWLTVPAIWSDEARFVTRKAALRAGFGSRPIDEINLVSEPEAAAIVALRTDILQTDLLLKPNTGVLVCDCGGGTVDITSYNVLRTEPILLLDESSAGTGGKCGGTYIDRNLHDLMVQRYGSAFSDLPPDRIGPNSRFMVAFESIKQRFSLSNTRKTVKLPLNIPQFMNPAVQVPGYDRRYGEIALSEADLLFCFDPIVSRILGLIDGQVQAVNENTAIPVKTVVLVGGLGYSKYIRDRIMQWCEARNLRLVTPSGAWSAVARGAVLHGLGTVRIQTRITRRHYGRHMGKLFDPQIHKKSGKQWDNRWWNPFSNQWVMPNHMDWLIPKNFAFEPDTEIVSSWNIYHNEGKDKLSRSALYSCNVDEAPALYDPDFYDNNIKTVGTLVIDLSAVDLSKYRSMLNEDGTRKWKIGVEVFIKLGDRKGVLTFRTQISGKDVGTATIDFSEH